MISETVMSVASNLGGGQHKNLALTMMVGEYMEQRGLEFVLPQNPGNYPQGMGSAQEQALRTEKNLTKPSAVLKIHRLGRRL